MSTPDPATTDWVPLGATVGFPTPVVNGQWIKGSGGAAIWSPITQADLPTNLRADGQQVSDANTAISNGWYRLAPGATNGPDSSQYFVLSVVQYDSGQVFQMAYQLFNRRQYERRLISSSWQGWWPSNAPGIAYEVGGWPGGGVARMQAAQATVSCPAGNPAVVNVNLPNAWASSHNVFLCSGWPGAHWNFETKASLPNGLTQGMVSFRNDTVQNITISWISVGY